MKDPKIIEETIAKALEAQQVELVDLVIQHQGHKAVLQFILDKIGCITLYDFSELTDKIDSLLEMENLISGAYVLEVSSPGVNCVLKKPEHFKRFTGDRVKVIEGPFKGLVGNVKRIKKDRKFVITIGTIAAFTIGGITHKMVKKIN